VVFRRISTKLVVAVLAAVVLPFGGFAVFVDVAMANRSLEFVKNALKGIAVDLAEEVDRNLRDRERDVELWSRDPDARLSLAEARDGGGAGPTDRREQGDRGSGERAWDAEQALAVGLGERPGDGAVERRREQTLAFDRYVANREVYDLILLVGADGRLVACNSRDATGAPLAADVVERLFAWDFAAEPWFASTLTTGRALVDQHRSPLLALPEPDDPARVPATYHVGVASAVRGRDGAFAGCLFGLVNWRFFDELLKSSLVKDYFRGLVRSLPTPYAWLWGADADTIYAHKFPERYRQSVSGPEVGLPQMVEDARAGVPGEPGLFREYTFLGVRKNAAFMRCRTEDEGGLGWYVGVGIDNVDIYASTKELDELLYKGTSVVLLIVVLWTLVVARRTTSPILALQQHTRRVAAGDLTGRVEIDSKDELGELADAFNAMTRDLADQREQLIKAEKDAAWREMARQIAHDIKNPLTPIKLSLDLLRRAREERRGDVEALLDRTLELIDRQVANLREIATDFYEFTGGRRPRIESVPLGPLLDEVLELDAAWAQERGIAVVRGPVDARVRADRGKLRRVVENLVANAFQAMPDGGELAITVREVEAPGGGRVVVELSDTGVGLTPDVRAHLFEPYFTTRGEGTGLGLAIAKRVLEEMGGTIELRSRTDLDGRGTVACVELAAAGTPGADAAAGGGGAA